MPAIAEHNVGKLFNQVGSLNEWKNVGLKRALQVKR